MKRIVVLASGSGTLAQAIFDAHFENAEVVALICDKPGAQVMDRAEKLRIESYCIPMLADRNKWNSELESLIAALRPDLVVSAGFMRIIGPKTVGAFRGKIINTHPAMLPNFPGAHAVRDALAAGATVTGSTVHYVDEGMDTGPIITQLPVNIEADDTEASLHERIKIVERELLVQTVRNLTAR